jgi:hypothetical protein
MQQAAGTRTFPAKSHFGIALPRKPSMLSVSMIEDHSP